MTTPSKSYVGDVGTEIELDCKEDITTATSLKIAVMKPEATSEILWDAVLVDTTKVNYIIQAGDFDIAGKYKYQAVIEMPSWSGRGETASRLVFEHFE